MYGTGATIRASDIYGNSMGAGAMPPDSVQASGPIAQTTGPVAGSAFSWATLVVVLVFIRIVYEFADMEN